MKYEFYFKEVLRRIIIGVILLLIVLLLNSMSKKSEKEWYALELEKTQEATEESTKCCGPDMVPPFSFGLEFLGLEDPKDDGILWSNVNKFVDDWFENPRKYMSLDGMELPKDEEIKIKDGFITFPSILNKKETAKFKYDPQPEDKTERKVALIHVMHWGGKLKLYNYGITLMRDTLLPITTLIHVPAGREMNPGEDSPADYESVSPNIGKTIFKTRQDVLDIEFMAKYLKDKLGYEQVGLFTYSIGSLRGILASIFAPEYFDFAVFHMVADNFTDSVMKGVATAEIAKEIKGKIDMNLLNTFWLTISPGRYSQYLDDLPEKTRLVQARHDFIFGRENVEDFNFIARKNKPDIEIANEDVGHSTFGHFPTSVSIMMNDIKFIYLNTLMKEDIKAKLFGI